VYELSPHPVPPELVLSSFTAGGGRRLVSMLLLTIRGEPTEGKPFLLGDQRSAQPPNSLRALSIRSVHCQSSPGSQTASMSPHSCARPPFFSEAGHCYSANSGKSGGKSRI
jgi:hypothetical protein